MGAGIAQVSAQAGYHVYLSDVSLEVAEKARDVIAHQLARLVEKEKLDAQEMEVTMGLNNDNFVLRFTRSEGNQLYYKKIMKGIK